MIKKKNSKPEPLQCEDCGRTDETVRETLDPYDDDVENIQTPVILCARCEELRARDI